MLRSAIFAGKNADDTSTFWAMEAGIHKKWIDLGPTTIFGQYYQMDGGANERQAVGGADAINPGIGGSVGRRSNKRQTKRTNTSTKTAKPSVW